MLRKLLRPWGREREREEEGYRDRYIALKQGNSLLGLFHKAADRQKSAPSRLAAQS